MVAGWLTGWLRSLAGQTDRKKKKEKKKAMGHGRTAKLPSHILPKRVTLTRLTNMTVGEGIRSEAGRLG